MNRAIEAGEFRQRKARAQDLAQRGKGFRPHRSERLHTPQQGKRLGIVEELRADAGGQREEQLRLVRHQFGGKFVEMGGLGHVTEAGIGLRGRQKHGRGRIAFCQQ